ncbi:MAG TPA: RsmG family class I SAM-dependent methyltransferase, partial [Trueperaceae bacterium]|nr:RsmG family class I SAM-dependent methyltransferase [Trueperaceae bacterium]
AYAAVIEDLTGGAPTIVDVGSGAGLPGVVVAASLPAAKVVLVERRRRRGAFLELAASRLGLANVSIVKGDVKSVRDLCADVVTAQAVAAMADVVRLTRHLQADPCYLVSRRGPGWLEELPAVRALLTREHLRHGLGSGTARSGEGTAEAVEPQVGAVSEPQAGTVSVEKGRAQAESTATFTVPVEKRLSHSGSLVALRLTGGPACRSSGS